MRFCGQNSDQKQRGIRHSVPSSFRRTNLNNCLCGGLYLSDLIFGILSSKILDRELDVDGYDYSEACVLHIAFAYMPRMTEVNIDVTAQCRTVTITQMSTGPPSTEQPISTTATSSNRQCHMKDKNCIKLVEVCSREIISEKGDS